MPDNFLAKVCSGCAQHLALCSFAKDRSKIDGLQTRCRTCRAEKDHANYSANPRRAIARAAARYQADKASHRASAAAWAADNPMKVTLSRRKWRETNRVTERDAAKIAAAIKRKTSPAHRLNRAMSRAVWGTLKRKKQGRRWCEIVGYSQLELITQLERQFLPGMSWENYGAWHVDHKRPIVSFNFSSIEDEEFMVCWALGNLRPLWAKDNLRKNRKWSPEITEPSPLIMPTGLHPERLSPASG